MSRWLGRFWTAAESAPGVEPARPGHLRTLVPVLALALVVRLAVLAFWPQPVAHDGLTYDALGRHLAAGQGYVVEPGGPPTAVRGPVYPLFLASVYSLFGHRYGAVYLLQALVDTGTVSLAYAVAWGLYRRRGVAVLASLAYACYLPSALLVGQVMTETVFAALLLLGVWAYVLAVQQADGRGAWGLQAAAGASLGLAALTRPAGLVVPVVLALALPWLVRGFRRAVVHVAILLAAFMLVLFPWTWRNWQLFGELVPTSTLGGVNLYIGQYTLERADYLTGGSADGARRNVIITRALAKEADPGLNELELDRAFLRRALGLIRGHPWRYLHLCANRVFRLWFNLGYGLAPPSAASWALAGVNGLALALAVLGLWKGDGPALAWVLAGLLAAFTLFHMAILAYVRFILPVMPLTWVLAARGFEVLRTRGRVIP